MDLNSFVAEQFARQTLRAQRRGLPDDAAARERDRMVLLCAGFGASIETISSQSGIAVPLVSDIINHDTGLSNVAGRSTL